MKEAVRGGLGVGHLWTFLAAGDEGVVAIRPVQRDLSVGLWLLTHEDVPRNRRVESFLQTMPGLIAERLEGEAK